VERLRHEENPSATIRLGHGLLLLEFCAGPGGLSSSWGRAGSLVQKSRSVCPWCIAVLRGWASDFSRDSGSPISAWPVNGKRRAPSAPFLMVGFIQATLGYRGKRLDVPELS
jgi:hypothetical protein